MIFALVGQPNCGKSTLFNEAAGYRSMVGNFPGITASYTQSVTQIGDKEVEITDLPGLYSLFGGDEAEQVTIRYLTEHLDEIVIINVIDSSVLSRSLELTLQVMELNRPMIVGLNMMDEARRKGLNIDIKGLSDALGVPVLPLVARKGQGISEMLDAALKEARPAILPAYSGEFLTSMGSVMIQDEPDEALTRLPVRFLAMRRLETRFNETDEETEDYWATLRDRLSELRHDLSFRLFERFVQVGPSFRDDWRRRLDEWFLHPLVGYVTLMLFFVLLLWGVMTLASPGGIWMSNLSERLHSSVSGMTILPDVLRSAARGLLDGILGGIDISLFYLLPFFFFLGLVEDSGYLARVAFLMDRLMHRIGLHGLSVIPMMLGLGCTVPAILSTRMITSRRDRLITAVLVTLIPCSARTVVILGLVGAVFGVWSVLATYVLVVLVVAASGKVLARFNNRVPPGFLVEMPRYHLPRWRTLWPKTWFRIKDFLVEAWPLLIVGSIALEWIRHFHLEGVINGLVAPLTSGILGLPAAAGIVLLFGIMRKELALLLLVSAMGVSEAAQLARLLSAEQILVFTLFITFYIPCLATVAVLKREFGWKMALWSSFGTFVLAVIIGLLVRLGFWTGGFLV